MLVSIVAAPNHQTKGGLVDDVGNVNVEDVLHLFRHRLAEQIQLDSAHPNEDQAIALVKLVPSLVCQLSIFAFDHIFRWWYQSPTMKTVSSLPSPD